MPTPSGLLRVCSPLSLLLLAALCGTCSAEARSDQAGARSVSLSQAKAGAERYREALITVDGFVDRWLDQSGGSVSFYVLKDNYGNHLPVRTTAGNPALGSSLSVTGFMLHDTDRRMEVLDERSRASAVIQGVGAGGISQGLVIATIGGGVVLVILAIAVLKSLGRTPAPTSRPAPRPAVPRSPVERRPLAEAPPDGPGGSGDLDRTVKVQGRKLGFEMPIDTTYKVLPGRFKVTGGDDQVQEIKLYQISAEPVFTFGRKPGPACRHIRVDDKTVSSKQAELRYANGVFTIQNQSETNPTVVDGLELGVGQAQELMDGSQIVMGEVVLQFEASKRGS